MKIGIMNNPSKSVYDEATFCGTSGFDFLDLTVEGPNAYAVDVGRLQSILQSYNLTVTGHTDPCLPYAYPVQAVRDACLQELERCAVIFSALGARVMNIHPCYYCSPALKRGLLDFNIEALQPIVAMAEAHELSLVFENYIAPFDKVSTFKTLLTEVPGLKVHLDFGHTNFGRDSHETFCRELGQDIRHVHFSDNRGRTDDHMPLGIGTINWRQAIDVLKATGYDGTITLEVFCNNADMNYNYLDMSRKLALDLWAR